MDRRLKLSQFLRTLVSNVYFQPTEDVTMEYPCIVYNRDGDYRASADNEGYHRVQKYQVTLIDRDPENPAFETLAMTSQCRLSRSFQSDGLNHDVFELYY